MAGNLILPDGVRLATREELPGPADRREAMWARICSANINAGYTIKAVQDRAFRYYAEANVDAPKIWPVFRELSRALLGLGGALLLSFKDDEPERVAEASVEAILDALEKHKDQLSHDGYIQFGIVTETDVGLSEVFVTPSKHFKVWFSDERAFAAQMTEHALLREQRLEFVDEYPRVTTRLPDERALWLDVLRQSVVGALQS